MPLTLLLGPANCGKVAQLFDRFAEQVDAGAAPRSWCRPVPTWSWPSATCWHAAAPCWAA
jgi:hypothetical protein